jgi:hypothetical protein
MTDNASANSIKDFIRRWEASGAAERANFQSFLNELCVVLDVPRPDPAQQDDNRNEYVFERAVTFNNGDGSTSPGRIDLYKRGCFVMEAKQGSDRRALAQEEEEETSLGAQGKRGRRRGTAVRGTRGWDDAMLAAKGQAEQYARALPVSEVLPPFLVVVDVGYSIELYSDFSRSGKTYIPFPDAREFRIPLGDLAREDVRERLRLIWTEPLALDPSRRSAKVTREVAARLARLAKSLEDAGHQPERVASFLMRAIFTMFAEDVKLIPAGKFTETLLRLRGRVKVLPDTLKSLWTTMNEGGFSPVLMEHLLRFNGGLFESSDALPLTEAQLELLIEASKSDWKDVEPAIFGTLLERALNPVERHKLGAHYTPRAYVERLVMPTIIEPLREEWEAAKAAAVTLANAGRVAEAADEVTTFLRKLCRTRVLDPACGSGNFLYVTLEHMKRLEGEVLDALHGFKGQTPLEGAGLTVDPHLLLGLEVNPRAAAIADMVLWIGYLQWHFRTRGEVMPPVPVLKKFHNIEHRDAVLAYDSVEPVTDERGERVTRWDGRTTKQHPVTGEDVPDETARVPVLRYVNPRKAEWPEADYIIGNPPFIGNKRMRFVLGDGYVEALRKAHDDVPETVDFVMYWWNHAAKLARNRKIQRFGFITTNSITQPFNRKVLENYLDGSSSVILSFAIPDHPWVDSTDGAAVRIAMTVGATSTTRAFMGFVWGKSVWGGPQEKIIVNSPSITAQPIFGEVINEQDSLQDNPEIRSVEIRFRDVTKIHADLSSGVDVTDLLQLRANTDLAIQGLNPLGLGFRLSEEDLIRLGLNLENLPKVVRRYLIGRDLMQVSDTKYVIDFYGLTEEEARHLYPSLFQHILVHVKPERDQNRRETRRVNWWLFGENAPTLRRGIAELSRYIATCRTAKHRVFTFLPSSYLPDAKIIGISLSDAFYLGVLSSQLHIVWALRTGAFLEDRPNYNHADCFNKFPFPDCTDEQKARIRELGESLNAHRKRQQAQHPRLTITDMYNVLEKLRAGESLTDKERLAHEMGLVSVLKQIHDELDRAVFEAYGWPETLTDEEILERLVALNTERAREERNGLVRWLRSEFQHPKGTTQAALDTGDVGDAPAAVKQEKTIWPKTMAEQARAVRNALAAQAGSVTARQLAGTFMRANVDRVEELLKTLASLGQAREVGEGRFVA